MRALPLALVGACVAACVAAVACTTDYQKGLDDPNFGAPNALAGQKQPGPTSETVTDGGGSGASQTPACVQAGGALVSDAGTCSVTFKSILAAFKAASCQTTGSCHGGASPPNQPRIDPDDPNGMYTVFTTFRLSNGKLYVNPCSTEPTDSTIACNVSSTGTCGSQLMPPGVGLAPNVVADITTWLKCGAPND